MPGVTTPHHHEWVMTEVVVELLGWWRIITYKRCKICGELLL